MAMKIASIVGARPNYVKLAAVYEAFSKVFDHVVVDTGQHYDYEMNRVFYDQLEIPEPHYFLGVGSGSHGYQVGEVIKRAEEVLFREMPKETNRRVIDHISTLLFAPTKTALSNLRNEDAPSKAYLVGDIHVYILKKLLPIAEERSGILERLYLRSHDYVLITLHRAENVDNTSRLFRLLQLIDKISQHYKVVFPIHPRTRKNISQAGLDHFLSKNENLVLSQPLGYVDFINY